MNLYDYGARNYDAALGRWMNVDPLAEEFPGWNPYHYVHNNPMNLIDPTGMAADGWVKSENKNGESTYTYDETINSQEDANKSFPGMKKQYLGENFTLIGKIAKQVAYQYNFQGKNVTDGSGNKVDVTNNHKTEGGTTIMNPDNTGGTYAGIMIGGAVGGGISLELGVVRDNFGSANFYFSFGGHSGLGGGVGISAGVITPTNNQTFSVNDFNGHGNSFSVNVGFVSYERGGTQGDGFNNFGTVTSDNRRPYIFSAGSQAGHYPGVSLKDVSPKIQYRGISGGAMISSTKTWVF